MPENKQDKCPVCGGTHGPDVQHDNVLTFKGEKPKIDVSKNHAMTPPPASFDVKP